MMITDSTWSWLTSATNWQTTPVQTGIIAEAVNHLEYSAIALGIGLAIGLPLGLAIGHTGKGTFIVATMNSVRALPTLGLLVLFYVVLAPQFRGHGNAVFLIPTEIALVLLAIPPILANAYAGVQNVSPEARDAARGIGMTSGQRLRKIEIPNALPLIYSGFRSAALQVISTATVAAYVGLGGLGRFIYDGLGGHDFAEVTAGAILVAALALIVDLAIAIVQRYTTSPGVTGRYRHTRSTAADAIAAPEQPEAAVI